MNKTLMVSAVLIALLTGCSEQNPISSSSGKNDTGDKDKITGSDSIFLQGSIENTASLTDFAISGDGFFVIRKSSDTLFYRRPGRFIINNDGFLVLKDDTAGHLMGIKRFISDSMIIEHDSNAFSVTMSNLVDIRFNLNGGEIKYMYPSGATTVVKFSGNLDSDGEGMGTVIHSQRFLMKADATTGLTNLYDRNGNSLGITINDNIVISIAGQEEDLYQVDETMTLFELAGFIQMYLREKTGDNFVAVTTTEDGFTVDLTASAVPSIDGLQIRSSRAGSSSYVANALAFPPSILNSTPVSISGLRTPANEDCLLSDTYNANGQALGLESGDIIRINGAVGGMSIAPVNVEYNADDPLDASSISMLGDLVMRIQEAFSLPSEDGTIYKNKSVSMNTAGTCYDNIPDGSIVIRGQAGRAFGITALSILASDKNDQLPAPAPFNANCNFTEIQAPRDPLFSSAEIVVYDRQGNDYLLTTTFTHSNLPNIWHWESAISGGYEMITPGLGTISFGQDGSLSGIGPDDIAILEYRIPVSCDSIDVSESCVSALFDTLNIRLDFGETGTFSGITQFRSETSAAAYWQDGNSPSGFNELVFGDSGSINAVFADKGSVNLYNIPFAFFLNRTELEAEGIYLSATPTSGVPVLRLPDESELQVNAIEGRPE